VIPGPHENVMITRLNHAVLWVADAHLSAVFYTEVLGFAVVGALGSQAIFLRAGGSGNDHDLGLFSTGVEPSAQRRSPGLYHLAWQVPTIDDLAGIRSRLLDAGAFTGESDHGVSKSVYGRDLDGIEFEIMWAVPREAWPAEVFTRQLNLDAELARWATVDTAGQ
jgi:catechol-2,3-dioxygenase